MSYPLSSFPKWVKEKFKNKNVGDEVQLTGTIFGKLLEFFDEHFYKTYRAIELRSSIGCPVSIATLK